MQPIKYVCGYLIITSKPLLNAVEEEKESLQQPLWHLIVLCILTCNAYAIYWCYKSWRDLAATAKATEEGAISTESANPALAAFLNISPMLRTIGLSIIGLDIYLVITLVKGIAELYPNETSYVRRHPLLASGLLVASCIAILSLNILPKAWFLLSFLVGIPLAVAQYWLNAFWRSVEPSGLVVRHGFTIKEMAIIIIGSLWLGLIVAGFFIMP